MKKKIISTILALVGISILVFAILLFLGNIKDQQSGILVESDPIATVYINDVEVGKTPYEANRESGEILLRLRPDPIEGVVLDDYETKINLVAGIRTIVRRVFRETEMYSSGVIVSFNKLMKVEPFVTVVSVPDNAEVSIDGKKYGYTPLRIKIPAGDYNLVISLDKYLEESLPIRVYAGYQLTASVKLAKLTEQKEGEQLIQQDEKVSLGRIKINKTDTGFLRVRSGANIGFPEITQVKPGEEYDILEEGERGSWYKIKIVITTNEGATSEIQGWVSREFVTKL